MTNNTNPVMNQIKSLTGSSLANKVEAPKEKPVVTGTDNIEMPESRPENVHEVPESRSENVQQPTEQQPIISIPGYGDVTPDVLENLQDPVSYGRRRFQKVQPYIVTMPNGDKFETDSLDKAKIKYKYLQELRKLPSGPELQAQLAQQANLQYWGYQEVPKGIKENFFGAAGRGAVNTITSMPFDIWNALQIAGTGLNADMNLPDNVKNEVAKIAQENIDATLKAKNDFTAHPDAYWVDVEDTAARRWGTGIGSIAASVVPAFMTSGMSIGASAGANLAGKVALKAATKAATKRMGTEAVKSMGKKAAGEAAEGMAKRALNIGKFMRNPNFDPLKAKQSLSLLYTNRIANAGNYLIAAGEASGATVDVYLDTLSKTNDINLAVGNALAAGGIVGVLGASPEWASGALGALFDISGKMTRAALKGDKKVLRWLVAGNTAVSGTLEGASEVLQDVTTAEYTNKPIDTGEAFMTFALASLMASSMTLYSNRNMPTNAIKAAAQWRDDMKAWVKVTAAKLNAKMPEGSKLITEANIKPLMEIIDDPNFVTLAQKTVKKGILENVDKMEDMPNEDKQAFLARLQDPEVDVSTGVFEQFDREIDNTYLKGATNLTASQRAIFRSILHGVARYGILAGKISSPLELLYGKGPESIGMMGVTTGGMDSYTEGFNVNIGTENNAHIKKYNAGKADVNSAQNIEQLISAEVNNKIKKSATKGMTQGSVDILHEVLGHLFASDVVAKGDLPHFLMRYTELLQEAIAEVMPDVDLSQETDEVALDEYRAYAMANSSKIAEMLGFKGDTARLFGFFEQMALADSANFGAIKEYIQALRTLLDENSMAIRAMIDNYGKDLPAAIKHYADTGDIGMLTEDDLKALSRVMQSGLADSDAKLDLMSIFGDNDTFKTLTERLTNRFNEAVTQDKEDAKYAFNTAMQTVKSDSINAPKAPVNEEAVETIGKTEQELGQAQQPLTQAEKDIATQAIEDLNKQIEEIRSDAEGLYEIATEETAQDASAENVTKMTENADALYQEAMDKIATLEKVRDGWQQMLDSDVPVAAANSTTLPADTPLDKNTAESIGKWEQKLAKATQDTQPKEDNRVTFDGKNYYYLTKKALPIPKQKNVKDVKHPRKAEGEPESEGKETYRAAQLATTGLTQTELDGLMKFALDEIKINAPGIYDTLIGQLDEIAKSDVEIKVIPLDTETGDLSGYQFKFLGEIPVGDSVLKFDSKSAFSNANGGRTAALSSDIAYYIMAKRAAAKDNRRYVAHAIDTIVTGAIEQGAIETNLYIDAAVGRLEDYVNNPQAFTGNSESDTREARVILTELQKELQEEGLGSINVKGIMSDTSDYYSNRLSAAGDWYMSFYNRVRREKDVAKAKEFVKNSLKLKEDAIADLDSKKTKDEIMDFVHEHSNEFKYLPSTTRQKQTIKIAAKTMFKDIKAAKDAKEAVDVVKSYVQLDDNAKSKLDELLANKDIDVKTAKTQIRKIVHDNTGKFTANTMMRFSNTRTSVSLNELIDEALDSLYQDENAAVRDPAMWYESGKTLTKKQKDALSKAAKVANASNKKARDAAVAELMASKPEVHTTENDSTFDIIANATINESFAQQGYKTYTPLTRFTAEVGYAGLSAKFNPDLEGTMELKSATPEAFGFKSREDLDRVFDAYKIPSVVFDTKNYLYAPRTGKVNQDKIVSQNTFYLDFAEMAAKQLRTVFSDGNPRTMQGKLTYIKATIDAYEAAQEAYREYTIGAGNRFRQIGFHVSANGNNLLNPEGFEKLIDSVKKHGAGLDNSPLFNGIDKGVFDWYSNLDEPANFNVTTNTKDLVLGRVVQFPYGTTFRTGMIVVSSPVDIRSLGLNTENPVDSPRDRLFLIRTARTDVNGKTQYEEIFVPRSEFEELFKEGKSVLVSNGVFEDEGRAQFNKFFDDKLEKQRTGKGYTLHSGGAIGADSVWGKEAEKRGITANHYYAVGNKTPAGNVEVSQAALDDAKKHVLKANETLKRNIDHISKNVLGLLERNYEQVKNSDAVFAVGMFKGDQVDGGTGWAVQMAIDAGKPVYVFDQNQELWFEYDKKQKKFIATDETPKLTKNFAGVGTRKINAAGEKAIADVFDRSFGGNKFQKAVETIDTAVEHAAVPQVGENPENMFRRIESATGTKRYSARESISPEMAQLLKSLTPKDSVFGDDISPEDIKMYQDASVIAGLNRFGFRVPEYGKPITQKEMTLGVEAINRAKEMSLKSVADFAKSPYMGTQNLISYMNDLTNKANETRSTKWIHKIPLFLGSWSGTDRLLNMVFGQTPLSKTLAESAQIMTQVSEEATQKLQEAIVAVLKSKGKDAESFNEFFRNRLTNSPIQAELKNGKKVDITRGEIETLYAAYLVETTAHPNDKTAYMYPQSVVDGGNQIYTRLKDTMYKNADELIAQLTDTEKDVVKGMLDFFRKYTYSNGKRFVLSLGSYVKGAQKGWELRHQYFTRATRAEMTDMNSLLVVDDLFDTLNSDFKADAIYNSGVKKDLTAMKNMLLFGLNYSNAADGLSGYQRFLQDYRLKGDENENSEDYQKYRQMLDASNNLREAVNQTLGKYGFERFMKRLDQEVARPEASFKLLPTWLSKFVERKTRAAMASKLAFKPKNAIQNFMGAWQRLCPLSDSTGKWYTTDLLDAVVHIKDVLEEAKNNEFIMQRYERNALGEEYQKVTDASSIDTTLSELSVWAKNQKMKGHVTAAEIFGKLDDFAKKMTKISVGYGTSGADFLALAMGWYKLKPSLQKQALEISKAQHNATTAQQLFMNHVLRTISSSNFMTRSPLQNWALRNHLGALTAFLNDSLQSYGAIGEAWYMLHSAKTDAEKRYLRRVITSNIASQVFYVATQIGALSAAYGLAFTDDGLTDAEQEYLWDALWRETLGQISSVTPLDSFTRPALEALFLNEKRQGGNVLTATFQDLLSDVHDGDLVGIISNMGDLYGFAGTRRAVDVADAMLSAYSKDDQSYKILGEVMFGRTKNTALKAQGLRKNSKGQIVEKTKRK